MEKLKTWPRLAIIGLACLALAAGAVILWHKYEQPVQASSLPGAARIDRINGDVGFNRNLDSNSTNSQWVNAEQNTPVSVGDRIYTKHNSDASVAFTGRNSVRLNEDTSLDVLALEDQKTQVALRDGSAVFDIGNLSSGDLFEVATPCGAVDLTAPGLYQIELNDQGSATASALSGVAQVLGQGGTGRIEKGEVLTVPCQGSSPPTLTRVEPRAAGTLVDQYYHYRYPRTYDGRYASYDSYLNDPFYYDPYRRSVSYQYLSDDIPGGDDLDYYGDWQDVGNYGHCWRPRVDSGWAPYQSGYWTTDYPYGLTWVSNEPWGYAPYHYGRWAFVGNQWFWVPDRVTTRPVYSPALVAFIPSQAETIGWVPLAPGDPYAPRYYDSDWRPRYLTRTPVFPERVVNLSVPGAVTVVDVRNFDRPIDRQTIERVDARQFAGVQPVLDPFAIRNFRDAARRAGEGRRQFDVPGGFAQRMERPVIASTTPVTSFRRDLAQKFQVRSIPEKVRGEHWQFRDNRSAATAGMRSPQLQPPNQAGSNESAEQARERQMVALSREAARGNKTARQQMQQLEGQQRHEQDQQREQAAAQQRQQIQQAPGARLKNNVQGPKPAAQPNIQQPTLANRGPGSLRGNPRTNQEQGSQQQQQRILRHVSRPPTPQAQPRDRQPNLGPSVRQDVNRTPSQPKAAPEPRVMHEPRPVQRQAQPQPRMQQRTTPMRQPQPQKQQQKVERRPPQAPADAAAGQPQKKKGREHP